MQNIVIYPGSILELSFILNRFETKKIFLVTGKSSYQKSGAKDKISAHIKNHSVTQFYEFKTNPDLEDVKKGIGLFRYNNCDLIISVGGGSVIDMAKLINYYQDFIDIDLINENYINNSNFFPTAHICIPTTAGSGSEATQFAVLYINNIKFSISNLNLIPKYVIIDPEFHYSQTPYQKAVSGIDALAQSIESFWSVQSTVESRNYSINALSLIRDNLTTAVKEGGEFAHLKLAIASFFAGKAINIAKTTAPHALSYYLSYKLNIPHGHAVCLSLVNFISYNYNVTEDDCNDKRGVRFIKSNIMTLCKIFNTNNVNDLTQKLKFFLSNIDIELNLDLISDEKRELIKSLPNHINIERLNNNPRKIKFKHLKKLFKE